MGPRVPYNSAYGANQKDGLEDYLHDQVCHHGLPLTTAQQEIAVNWYTAWVAAGRPTPQDFGYGSGSGSDAVPQRRQPGPASGQRRVVHCLRRLQLVLRRLRRVRALEPAKPDRDGQCRWILQELEHGQLRLRRRLSARPECRHPDKRDSRIGVVLDNGKRMMTVFPRQVSATRRVIVKTCGSPV